MLNHVSVKFLIILLNTHCYVGVLFLQNALTLPNIVQSFEKEFEQLARLCYWITTDSSKLLSACTKADKLSTKARSAKHFVQKRNEENKANMFFSMECAALSLKSLGKVWLELKAENPHEAWHALIDSQEYLRIAIQAHGTPQLAKRLAELDNIELTLFPQPGKFISAGIIFKSGRCTICGLRFDKCEHEEDLIYVGELCKQVQRRIIEVNHVALVDKPRDKRCYVNAYEDDNGMQIDYFSQIINTRFSESKSHDEETDFKTKKISAILMNLRGLPYIYPCEY